MSEITCLLYTNDYSHREEKTKKTLCQTVCKKSRSSSTFVNGKTDVFIILFCWWCIDHGGVGWYTWFSLKLCSSSGVCPKWHPIPYKRCGHFHGAEVSVLFWFWMARLLAQMTNCHVGNRKWLVSALFTLFFNMCFDWFHVSANMAKICQLANQQL